MAAFHSKNLRRKCMHNILHEYSQFWVSMLFPRAFGKVASLAVQNPRPRKGPEWICFGCNSRKKKKVQKSIPLCFSKRRFNGFLGKEGPLRWPQFSSLSSKKRIRRIRGNCLDELREQLSPGHH